MIILILTNSKTVKEGPQSSAPLPLSRHPSSLHSAVFPSAFIFLSSTDLDKAIHAFIASHCCVSIPIPASVWSHFEFYSSFRMQQLGFQLNAKQRHHNIPKFCVAFWSRFRYVWKGQKGSSLPTMPHKKTILYSVWRMNWEVLYTWTRILYTCSYLTLSSPMSLMAICDDMYLHSQRISLMAFVVILVWSHRWGRRARPIH